MPHRLYDLVAARAGHRCEYCTAPEALFNTTYEVEHITPLARGGTDDLGNLALSCRACNGSKYIATDSVDPADHHSVRLFHPRDDLWAEHFSLDVRTAEIEGLTDVGRGTVERLRMNGPTQLAARRLWIYLVDFPNDPPVPPS
jgi:hypothetical protein